MSQISSGLLAVYLWLLLILLLHYSVFNRIYIFPTIFLWIHLLHCNAFSIAEHSFLRSEIYSISVMQLESACLLTISHPMKTPFFNEMLPAIMHTTDVFILCSTDRNFLWPRWWLSPSRLLTIAPTLTIAHEKRGGGSINRHIHSRCSHVLFHCPLVDWLLSSSFSFAVHYSVDCSWNIYT